MIIENRNPHIEKRIIGEPGGPSGPYYSVITPSGRVVAMQIPDKKDAEQIKRIPEYLDALHKIANSQTAYDEVIPSEVLEDAHDSMIFWARTIIKGEG